MRRFPQFPRELIAATLAGVAALLVASALPHQHPDGSAAHHAPSACQLCRIQQQTVATPTATGVVSHVVAPVVSCAIHAVAAPRTVPLLHASAPRSPPAIS